MVSSLKARTKFVRISQPDFETSLRQLILTTLPLGPNAIARRTDLAALQTRDLLIVYYNWRNRLVHPHPRRVHRSKAFVARLASYYKSYAIGHVLGKIAAGQVMTAHLSRGIRFGWEPGGKTSVRDFDLLLNDWGVHHLHIGPTLDSDGFVVRDGDVIAILFRPGAAYALDVVRHREWATVRLVETAVRTWPRKRLFLPLPGIQPGTDYTQNERQSLRQAGMPSPITVDGIPYVSSTIMSTARTTMQAAQKAANTIRRLTYIEAHMDEVQADFERAAEAIGTRMPRSPKYQIVGTTNPGDFGLGIEEIASGAVVGVMGP